MAKHNYDLGNYEYCSEKGKDHGLKYALLSLSVSNGDGEDSFVYEGSCVPDKCSADDIKNGYEEAMKAQYNATYHTSNGLYVSFPDEQEPKMSIYTIITLAVFILSILMVIVGTVVDRTSYLDKPTNEIVRPNVNDDGEPVELPTNQIKCRLG